MDTFEGRVAVITGAGSGFGREFARLGHRLGMRLVLADVQQDALAAVCGELGADPARVIAEPVDVSRPDQVERLAQRTFDTFGAANLLFNNAGVGGGGFVWESSERDWAWVMGVNVNGVVNGLRSFVPRMLESERRNEPGHVVNTASMAGWLCAPAMGVYNASKHAVVALTETLHHDLALAGSRIGTTLLCPAFVPTGIANSERNRPSDLANAAPPTASQRMAQQASEKAVSSGRLGAQEVAQMTFDAIRDRRFYVFTHPQILPSVQDRFDAVLHGRMPADPFASRPDRRPRAP
ncbi:MAG TPA: SDR family oxidoreductase [Burkholderiaceae bacterium]|nr:SDR family oxidoreductase [Burkholderiaceae bacterium]